jgi:sulfatase modifying factor 1
MKCGKCNQEVSEGSKYCHYCGTPLPPSTTNSGDVVAVGGSTVVKADIVYMGTQAISSNAQECPICGRHNPAQNTFRCKSCQRRYLCLNHQDPESYICSDCVQREERLKAAFEADQKALAEAKIQAKNNAEKRRIQEAYERLGDRTSLKLDDSTNLSLVPVPAGEFIMGSNRAEGLEDEKPEHVLYLDEYLIGQYPVTVRDYSVFVTATGYKTFAEKWGYGYVYKGGSGDQVAGASWQHPFGPDSDVRSKDFHPVTIIGWEDAIAFCRWLSDKQGVRARLPNEAEWEKAARGVDGRIYPWGNEPPNEKRCNFGLQVGDTTRIGEYFNGVSFYGCYDMAGNVFEWTNSIWGHSVLDYLRGWEAPKMLYGYPYRSDDGRETTENIGGSCLRVHRGGDWHHAIECLTSTYRGKSSQGSPGFNFEGFRVCISPNL